LEAEARRAFKTWINLKAKAKSQKPESFEPVA